MPEQLCPENLLKRMQNTYGKIRADLGTERGRLCY